MSRTPLLFTAVLALSACDKSPEPPAAQPENAAAEPDQDAPEHAQAEEAEEDPWKKTLEARVLADSGLGVGGKLSAFQIRNGETGEEYCQVCRYGPSPKVMVVGQADDPGFKEDLENVDAIVAKYGADKLKAFAVVTEFEDGKAVTPKDLEAAQARAKALKEELGVSLPVVVPAPEDGGANKIWEEYYNITKSRTVMFADGKNQVLWNGIATDDYSGLAEAFEKITSS